MRWGAHGCVTQTPPPRCAQVLALPDFAISAVLADVVSDVVPAASDDGASSRRRDCHFTGTPCLSLLKRLIKLRGGAIQ